MRSERIVAATCGAALLAGAGCSSPESYIVLNLTAKTTPITGVANIEVDVSSPSMPTRTLLYPTHGTDQMTIDQTRRNLSVGFSGSDTGTIGFDVFPLNDVGCRIGTGSTRQAIKKGAVAFSDVLLDATLDCTHKDGGSSDGPIGTPLPGCDPVHPQGTDGGAAADGGATSDGGAATTACTSTQTCEVDCTPDAGQPRNQCIPAGAGAPGAACTFNSDCQVGSQCFDYSSLGCNGVRVCLKFCDTDPECAAVGAAGSGPGSVCQGRVMCPSFLTAYHTCTFNCDPRATAVSTRGGCPAGLACVMPGAMDQVDCTCPETSRTKHEGDACTSAADCAPGFICNRMDATMTCRAICRCDANSSGGCMATANDCPTAGTSCHAVTNDTMYGICLP